MSEDQQTGVPKLASTGFEAWAKWWSTLEEIETSTNPRSLGTKRYMFHRTPAFGSTHVIAYRDKLRDVAAAG